MAQVLDLCLAGDVDLLVDARILAEYRDVLQRPELQLHGADVEAFLAFTDYAEHVVAAPLPLSIPDQADAPFLEVAVAGGADGIVTGNTKHFRPREGRLDIAVLTPRQFLERIAGR